MGFILDLIVLAIIIITVMLSARRGFVKTVVETAGFIAAIVLAFTISTPFATATYDKIIEPQLIKAVEENTESAQLEAWNALPDFIVENSEKLGISSSEFTEKINANLSNGINSAVTTASQEVVKPIAVKLLGTIYSIILLIVLLIVVKFLAKFINKLFSFSIVGKLNRTLGGALGLLKGAVFAVLFCTAVALFISLSGQFLIFTADDIEKTFIVKQIINILNV